MPIFQPAPGEKVLFTGDIFWYKTKIMVCPGYVHLTDRRLVVEKDANPGTTPLTQMIIKAYRAQILHDIPLDTIKKISYQEKKALIVGKNHRFTVEFNHGSVTFGCSKAEQLLPLLPHVEHVEAK